MRSIQFYCLGEHSDRQCVMLSRNFVSFQIGNEIYHFGHGDEIS